MPIACVCAVMPRAFATHADEGAERIAKRWATPGSLTPSLPDSGACVCEGAVICILVVLNMIMVLLVQVVMHQLFQLVGIPQVPPFPPLEKDKTLKVLWV